MRLCGAPRRAWVQTRLSSVWSCRSQERCTSGQTSTDRVNHASSTECTQALSGTNTTKLTTTLTTRRQRLCRATSSTSSTRISSTNGQRHSTSWSPALTTRTLASSDSTPDLRTRISLSKSSTVSGSIPIAMVSDANSPTASSSCGSTLKGTVTEDKLCGSPDYFMYLVHNISWIFLKPNSYFLLTSCFFPARCTKI